MKIAVMVVLGVLLLVGLFVVWRYSATIRDGQRLGMNLMSEVGPVVATVEAGQPYSVETLTALAMRRDTRSVLFRALHEIKRPEVYPMEYGELWQIAESDLTVWLMHPNELGAVPDEMELVKEIDRSESDPRKKCKFFVFKFRMKPPHWSSDKGWTAGVAGPYWEEELSLAAPSGVFSQFESFDTATAEEHLQKAEELMLKALK